MSYNLTHGAISRLMRGQDVSSPVFQILGFKKIAGQGGADRYRLNISDGIHSHTFAMLATQLNHMIPEGKLESHSIIRADKVIANSVSEKRVLIILELTVIAKGCDVPNKIGNPAQWTEENANMHNSGGGGDQRPRPPPASNGSVYGKPGLGGTGGAPQASATNGSNSFYGGKPAPSTVPQRSSGGEHTGPTIPISDLNPYTSRCAIRARVTSKSDVRTWSNAKGEGKLFNLEVLDESGEIRLTGFNNSVDQFFDMLEIGQVYIFKNFQVKTSNRAFNSLAHEYELSMGNETQIFACAEDVSKIPQVTYNFVDIAKIEDLDKDLMIDVVGICKYRGELNNLTSRAGKEMKKREITLVDKSNREILVTLWNKQAEDFVDDSQPVLAIKGAKIGDYNGKNLSVWSSSSILINPDIPEAHALRGWYDNEGKSMDSRSLSSSKGGGGVTPWKSIRESNLADQVDSEKGDFFMAKVTVHSVKRESVAYMACPAPNCQKKVIDMGNGSYRCEKCCKEYPDYKWRLMVQVNFGDFSGNIWATCFQEAGEILLGQSAEILGPMHKDGGEAFDAVVKNATFKSYIVKFKSKIETFNNETRKKATVLELTELNYGDYAKKLAADLKESAF